MTRRKKTAREYPRRECEVCGKEFPVKHPRARRCSPKCRYAAWDREHPRKGRPRRGKPARKPRPSDGLYRLPLRLTEEHRLMLVRLCVRWQAASLSETLRLAISLCHGNEPGR
jgi:predicted nucleic acid-binding Zn ribbon protein